LTPEIEPTPLYIALLSVKKETGEKRAASDVERSKSFIIHH
jgi:hypothetical protein